MCQSRILLFQRVKKSMKHTAKTLTEIISPTAGKRKIDIMLFCAQFPSAFSLTHLFSITKLPMPRRQNHIQTHTHRRNNSHKIRSNMFPPMNQTMRLLNIAKKTTTTTSTRKDVTYITYYTDTG